MLKAGQYRLISKYPAFQIIDTTIFIPADTVIFVTLFTEKVIYDRNVLGINAISAENGIKNGSLNIYLMDSMNSNLCNEDLRFEFFYHIKYINAWKAPRVGVDRGLVSLCGTGKYDMKYSEYNKIVFNHFDKKYKRGWRHQVNRYAIGL